MIEVGQVYRAVKPSRDRGWVELRVVSVESGRVVMVADVKTGREYPLLADRLHQSQWGPRGGRHRDGYVLIPENGDES